MDRIDKIKKLNKKIYDESNAIPTLSRSGFNSITFITHDSSLFFILFILSIPV
jgi:hypothetical protein